MVNVRSATHRSSGDALQDDYSDYNMTLYDYIDYPMNDSEPLNSSVASAVRAVRSASSGEASGVTEVPTEAKQQHSWAFFPTLPTIKEQDNTDQRIVGGDEAIPGEIPWQVVLDEEWRDWEQLGFFFIFFWLENGHSRT